MKKTHKNRILQNKGKTKKLQRKKKFLLSHNVNKNLRIKNPTPLKKPEKRS